MRIVLQKFFVVVRLDDDRPHFAQPLDNHLRRITEIGDETETARASLEGEPDRIDRVMRHRENFAP